METKGKAVDSVIQYQLHKDGSNDFRIINYLRFGVITATQKDVDDYGITTTGDPIGVGLQYEVSGLDISYNEYIELIEKGNYKIKFTPDNPSPDAPAYSTPLFERAQNPEQRDNNDDIYEINLDVYAYGDSEGYYFYCKNPNLPFRSYFYYD